MAELLKLLVRAVKPRQQWNKDEVYDIMFVLRMIFALVIGVLYGTFGAQGMQPFLMYLLSQWFFGQLFVKYQELDVGAYDSPNGPVTMEGFMQSTFFFVLWWSVSHTIVVSHS